MMKRRHDASDAPKKRRGRTKDVAKKRRRRRELARDRGVEAVGLALLAFGCLVTALIWTGIRGTNNVAYQLPIIASGGLVAMGSFTVGGLLVVGGMVMTRFARLENAREAGPRNTVAPAAPADGAEHEVQLPEEALRLAEDPVPREKVKARRRWSSSASGP